MVGLMDYISGNGMWAADSDDLLRAAQAGSLPAYKELIRRGEMIQPSASDQGRHGRPGGPILRSNRGPEGLGLSMMSAVNQQPDMPAYLTGGLTPSAGDPTGVRNMARPSNQPDYARESLDFMSALGPQQQQAPNYLGAGLMTSPTFAGGASGGPSAAEQRLARIANGGDGAAAIQAGTRAAQEAAGEPQGVPVPGALGPLAQAMASLDDEPEDKYGGDIQKFIESAMKGTDPNAARMNALAQAGFAMAASGSPTFFGAVGQGGLAGYRAYQEQQDRDMANRVQAMRLAQGQQQYTAEQQRTRFGQQMDVAKQQEVQEENQRQDARARAAQVEQERHDRATEAYNQGALQISAANSQIALGNLRQAQDELTEKKRQFDAGNATEQELKRAQTRAYEAQAAASGALGVDRDSQVVYTQDGGAAIVSKSTGKSVPVVGEDGNPIKVMGKSTSSWEAKRQAMLAGGYTPEDIAAVAAGKKQISEADAVTKATAAAAAKSRNEYDPVEAQRIYQDEYDRVYGLLTDNATPSSAGPSTEAPAGSAAPGSGQPITPKSQADIDNAPSGTKFIINGKTFVKP